MLLGIFGFLSVRICVHFLFEKKGRYMRIHLIEHSVVIGGFLFDFAAGSLC